MCVWIMACNGISALIPPRVRSYVLVADIQIKSCYIGGKTITWSERVKYLGCYFRCNTGEVDLSCFVGKFYHFYGNFNNIINVLGSKRDEVLTVHLVKTYCLPSLLYGCEYGT